MQGESSASEPVISQQPPDVDGVPTLNVTSQQNSVAGQDVTLWDSSIRAVNEHSSWVLCLLFGSTIYLQTLSQLAVAWFVAAVEESTWGPNALDVVLDIYRKKSIMWALGVLVFSRLANIYSRPTSSAVALLTFVVGSIIAAAAPNLSTFVAGMIIHTVANAGISVLITIFIADYTSLRWRGLALSWTYFPYAINIWISPLIMQNVNWRWIYGMFAIMIPVLCIPALAILFFARARQAVVPPQASTVNLGRVLLRIDPLGLFFFLAGFTLILHSSESRSRENKEQASHVTLISGLILLFPCFFVWELMYAPFPLMPRAILRTKVVQCAIGANLLYRLADSLWARGLIDLVMSKRGSLVLYILSSSLISSSAFAPIFGAAFFFTRHYKLPLLVGHGMLILGAALMVYYTCTVRIWGPLSSAILLFVLQTLRGAGSVGIELGLMIGSQATVSHENLSAVIALMIVLPSVQIPIANMIWSHLNTSGHVSSVIVSALVLGIAIFCLVFSLAMPNYRLSNINYMGEEEVAEGGHAANGGNGNPAPSPN